MPVTFLNQCMRRASCLSCTVPLNEESKKFWITDTMHRQITNAKKTWAWTSVLVKSMYWGIAFVSLNVIVAKFTILFLSWLIDTCKTIKDSASSDIGGRYVGRWVDGWVDRWVDGKVG